MGSCHAHEQAQGFPALGPIRLQAGLEGWTTGQALHSANFEQIFSVWAALVLRLDVDEESPFAFLIWQ